jgi:hypothetical protein
MQSAPAEGTAVGVDRHHSIVVLSFDHARIGCPDKGRFRMASREES